jgi:hypothetical protein
MIRLILITLLVLLVVRALWRVFEGVVEGMTGQSRRTGAPRSAVQMTRDPVCGTFVVPGRAVTLLEGRQQIYFCSDACRDKYRARTA